MMVRLDGSVRYFTILESAGLQTFPDGYKFYEACTETMRQLGNAAPGQTGPRGRDLRGDSLITRQRVGDKSGNVGHCRMKTESPYTPLDQDNSSAGVSISG